MIRTATEQDALKNVIFFLLVCCTCSLLRSNWTFLKNDFSGLFIYVMSLQNFFARIYHSEAISHANKKNKSTH